MKLSAKKITEIVPIPVHLYDSIDSTNNEAKRRAGTDKGVCLYAATRQTAGRGRRGHSFYSPDTGLYMTLSLPLTDTPAAVQSVTCAAAVAVCEAISELSDRRPQIKWVNDILVGGKKVAGILTELLTDSRNQPRAVIVGIGLNLKTKDFPEEFADRAGSLGEIDPDILCGTIAEKLIRLYNALDDNSVIKKYKRFNLCIGRTVSYVRDGCEHTAKAVDIAPDGSLIIEENGSKKSLHSGEISIHL